MLNNPTISKLTEYFENLPGIGPRQARRFVYYLLNKDGKFLADFASLIASLKEKITECKNCRRFFDGKNTLCEICSNSNRDKSILIVTEKDIDIENIEKSGMYSGLYFILGGLIPALGSGMPKEVKAKELFEKVKKETAEKKLKEIILAFAATSEGDNTSLYIEKILEPLSKNGQIKISRFGRGLSTGTELEYSDKETIANAFKNRR